MQKIKRLIHILSILSIVLGCSLFSPVHEPVVSSLDSYYKIEPDSILASLDQNDFEVFVSQNSSESHSKDKNPAVHWGQSDYLRIASAFSNAIWQEPIDYWDLHNMFFRVSCKEAGKGFEFASFEYFKLVKNGDKESRLRRAIHIDPAANLITVYETEYFPTSIEWNSVDLAALKFSAYDALKIAENNGGRDVRVSVQDNCFITASLAPDGLYEGWNMHYSLYGGNTSSATRDLLSVYVDQLSGDLRVIYPETK